MEESFVVVDTINRSKQTAPPCIGRKSIQVLRHEMVVERNGHDFEIGRSDMFLEIHTKADKTVQRPDWVENINKVTSKDPGSRMTSVNDDVAQVIGKDSRGHMRAMGGGVCKTAFKKMEVVLSQNQCLKHENTKLWKKLEDFEANMSTEMDSIKSILFNQQASSSTSNGARPSSYILGSTQALLGNSDYVNKEVIMFGGCPFQVVEKVLLQMSLQDAEDVQVRSKVQVRTEESISASDHEGQEMRRRMRRFL